MTTEKIYFEFDVERTSAVPPLNFRVLHNGTVVHEISADQEHVKIEIIDENAEHEIVFELLEKQPSHTRINEQGEIVQDAVITINNFMIDNIDVTDIFFSLSQYQHNFNGNGNSVVEKFYGTMGCNGTVTLKFSTPIYLWLLENM